MNSIDTKELSPKLIKSINSYPKYNWYETNNPLDNFPPEFNAMLKERWFFLLKLPKSNQIVFVNTSGFKYIRYGIKLNDTKNLINKSEFIDIPVVKVEPETPKQVKVPFHSKT